MRKSGNKVTSPTVASKARKLLIDPKSPTRVKSVAASDLAQAKPRKKG